MMEDTYKCSEILGIPGMCVENDAIVIVHCKTPSAHIVNVLEPKSTSHRCTMGSVLREGQWHHRYILTDLPNKILPISGITAFFLIVLATSVIKTWSSYFLRKHFVDPICKSFHVPIADQPSIPLSLTVSR
jgi:hypothetical protein